MEDFVVFCVSPTGPIRTEEDMIWIGRSSENALVIPNATVSAVHAFLRLEPDGKVLLQDAGSRNGTLVNNQQVPATGVGPPVELKTGNLITLGDVMLTFLRSEGLRNLVVQQFGKKPRP